MCPGALAMQGTAEAPEGWDYVAFGQAIQNLRESKVGKCQNSPKLKVCRDAGTGGAKFSSEDAVDGLEHC